MEIGGAGEKRVMREEIIEKLYNALKRKLNETYKKKLWHMNVMCTQKHMTWHRQQCAHTHSHIMRYNT